MKKKILIIIVIVAIIILGLITYFVISDLRQEEKLKSELNELSQLSNAENIDMDKVNEKLNTVVTKDDYAIVEKAFKDYLSDSFENSLEIANILNDEKITQSLTPENYKNDGPEFTNTKEYLTQTIEQLEYCKNKYNEFLTDEKAMSYINDKNLDDYYVNLYKDEIVGDLSNTDKTVENSINEVISLLKQSENIIDFLIENKNNWDIENDNIVFDDTDLSREYDDLISQL